MKKTILILATFIQVLFCYAQPLTVEEKKLLDQSNIDYSFDGNKVSLNYAWLLYRTGGTSSLKADTVLNKTIALQDHDPEALTFGHWGWSLRDGEKYVDWNNALFQAHIMFCGLWNEQAKMSDETKSNFISSCRQMVEAVKRRWDYEIFDISRDYVAYSNVFAMYIQTFTLAADRFKSPRFARMAKDQWARWYNHISFFGIDEFASPTYNKVIFNALLDIRDYSPDERIQKEATEVMDHIYLLQSALTHPLLKLSVSGVSRDYRNFTLPGDARSGVLLQPASLNYIPPVEAVAINERRKYPFEVIGKASFMPFLYKSYQLKDAAMGSMTGGAVFQQQIHCMAAVGNSETERAVAFLQGSYTPVNGFTDQIGTSALCVYNRLPTLWHLTQKHGVISLSGYKEAFGDFGIGITTNWKEKLNTPDHIILEAYSYELHLFPFAVKNERIESCSLELKHRTTTSPRYHPRPRNFDEYVFPEEPDWFGAYLVLVKSGTMVNNPRIEFNKKDGIRTFETNKGHLLKLFIAEKGDTKQLFNRDPALIPIFKIVE